jgi:hypothetical protein
MINKINATAANGRIDMKNIQRFPGILWLAVAALTACGGGLGDAEFVEACLRSSSPQGATEAMCQCGAREARAALEPKLFDAMVLDMQGKTQEAEALVSDLPLDQRGEFAMQQFAILGKCLDEK